MYERRAKSRQKPEPDTLPRNLIVHVYHKNNKLHTGTVRDISKNGVFLEIKDSRASIGLIIKLVFTLLHGNVIKLVRKKAIVTRLAPEGVGLKFILEPKDSVNIQQAK